MIKIDLLLSFFIGSNVAGDPYLDFEPKSSAFEKFLIHVKI